MNVIDRARERIERDGWYQGAMHGPDGSHCILGALSKECDIVDREGTLHPAAVALQEETGHAIAPFNDAPSTSVEDVLLVLKRASARLDEMSS